MKKIGPSLGLILVLLWGCQNKDAHLLAGLQAYGEKDYNTASIKLEPDAAAGNEAAALALGTLNALGKGVAKDIVKAGSLFDKVKADRLEDRYTKWVGESAAQEMSEMLALYRKGGLKEDPPPPPDVQVYDTYVTPRAPAYVPPVVEVAPPPPHPPLVRDGVDPGHPPTPPIP